MMSNFGCYQGQQVFVTGAGGFIGSHLVEALVRSGAKVRALVRYNSENRWGWLDHLEPEIMSSVEVVAGDIRDPDSLQNLASGSAYGFHLAALISIPYSYAAPRSFVETNIMGTLNVLQAACNEDLTRLVVTSTSEVYGTAQALPMDEQHPLVGQSPYSATKIGADQLAQSFYRSFNLPVVTLRPFNTFGPRQSLRAVIPSLIAQALEKPEVQVGNLAPKRDFNYVLDTVQGFLLAGASPHPVEGEVINLGTGQETAIQEVVNHLEGLLEKPINVCIAPERVRPGQSEVMRLCADTQKATRLLGYSPQFSLEEGLRQTLHWLQDKTRFSKADLYHV